MKILDTNLLVYAYDSEASQHEPAREWIESVFSGIEPVGLPWLVLLGFIRLTTNKRVVAGALSVQEALDIVDRWLEQSSSVVIHPTERHPAVLRRMLEAVGVGRNLTQDAHLAALAIEHNADLCSADADFARFPGVRWVDPLAPA